MTDDWNHYRKTLEGTIDHSYDSQSMFVHQTMTEENIIDKKEKHSISEIADASA